MSRIIRVVLNQLLMMWLLLPFVPISWGFISFILYSTLLIKHLCRSDIDFQGFCLQVLFECVSKDRPALLQVTINLARTRFSVPFNAV